MTQLDWWDVYNKAWLELACEEIGGGLLTGRSKALVISVPSLQHCYVSVALHFQAIFEGKYLVTSLWFVVSVKYQTIIPENRKSKDSI